MCVSINAASKSGLERTAETSACQLAAILEKFRTNVEPFLAAKTAAAIR
jgi:hypothetical protein